MKGGKWKRINKYIFIANEHVPPFRCGFKWKNNIRHEEKT